MAQDPEDEPLDEGSLNTTHELDMVPLYESQTINAEVEADVIMGLLESNGIPSLLGRTPYPSLGFELQVPKGRLEEARQIIREAEAAGPSAAAEAQAESEKG